MLALCFAAQLAVADSIYSTPAVRALVDSAAVLNSHVPASLQSYRARVESELAVLLRQSGGSEGALQIEQVASDVRWRRTGAYEQHVVGYRAQLAALSPSALAFLRQAWTVPVLYGNRLGLLFGPDTSRGARRRAGRDTLIVVVHPLAPAADREPIYRYSGGDTALTIRTLDDRSIPVIRVHVEPRRRFARPTAVFEGDLYLDAVQWQLVRLRGSIALAGGRRSLSDVAQSAVVKTLFVIDLTNAQVDGQYWLPSVQRIEGQIASPLTGTARAVLRVVSHFSHYTINDTVSTSDTLELLPHALSLAPNDSMVAFHDWTRPLGAATAAARADEYDDLAPDYWRPTGRPILDWRAERFADLVHIDRVEGLYTGLGAGLRFRDAAPGLSLRGTVGYAWTERTVRGGVGLDWTGDSGALSAGFRLERTLDNTNDFRTVFSSGPTLEALFFQDDYDYVDRRRATVYHQLALGPSRDLVIRWELGGGDDKGEIARLTRPPIFPWLFMRDSTFRPNRGVLPGGYARVAGSIVFNPGVDAGFAQPGVGFRLHDEWAGGDLSWQRAEARLSVREPVGPITVLGRVDGGIVTGTVIPPQQLFEIGTVEGMTAYDYKQFAGDRAAVAQGEVQYALPLLRAPLRLPLGLFFPGPAPALAVGATTGWAEVGTVAARRALAELGSRAGQPDSAPTDGIRTQVDFLIRAFGGALGIGVAKAVDHGGGEYGRGWNFLVVLGSAL